ncbi:MAG TPA: 16S rRNA (adenine(1518)-N(6)/adenine(1519)-N(6))-dimethyltransferase RsmA [Gemmataceae bacterium]|jgi:16S rRNA (adenine1518-N6/adenine1519-N6)-dimethyltransferase|nr:16S rRNA (adenine(1518)-N(6)/adenine(1519)-N(6))-dimethyltransferase RsmA [Gemmataceae bacterium]
MMDSIGFAPRQTQTYLRDLFAARGIHPKKKLGQNFLIDLNVMDVLLRAAEVDKHDVVLEVGTGTGSLTARLASEAAAVLSVEIDRDFHALAMETVRKHRNVELMCCDILKSKNLLNPVVLTHLEKLIEETGATRLKLVANLPYVVATPVIANLLLSQRPPQRMVVMVQAEIANRLTAPPGIKDYGALSVLVQSMGHVEIVRNRLPPTVFWPRPQVDSSIVLLKLDPEHRTRVGDPERLRHFLRDLYVHRRKNLRGALIGWPSGRRDKAEVDRLLAELGMDGGCRAEDLDVDQHLRLCAAFGAAG